LPYIGQALQDILVLKDSQIQDVEKKLKLILEKTRSI
jgi:hypothetical protein